MFPSPQLVEMLGYAGFDWVLLDCEHGSLSPADVELMCIAADAVGITPIGRPRTNSVIDIQVLMDRGVMGVQVPHVNTAADAARAVASVKFGSAHGRGLAAGTRPDDWGFSGNAADYIRKTNEETLVIVQFEHAEALPNVDEILKVEGVDVFFVGPSDLSQSLGLPRQSGGRAGGEGDQGHAREDRARRQDARHAGIDRECRQGDRPGCALHLHPRAAPDRRRRQGILQRGKRLSAAAYSLTAPVIAET